MPAQSITADIEEIKSITARIAKELGEPPAASHLLTFLKLIFDNLKSYVLIIGADNTILYMNPAVAEGMTRYGLKCNVGDKCYKTFYLKDSPCDHCFAKEAIETRHVVFNSLESPFDHKQYLSICIPLIVNGVSGVIELVRERNDE